MQEGRVSEVLDANTLFYRAFAKSDMRLMDRIWAKGDHVQCMHPGTFCISGREQVQVTTLFVICVDDGVPGFPEAIVYFLLFPNPCVRFSRVGAMCSAIVGT